MSCIQRYDPWFLTIGQSVGLFHERTLINKGKIIGIGQFYPKESPRKPINVICIQWENGSQSSLDLNKCHRIRKIEDD